MKRACILFFYDNNGIADEYNFYNIKELKTVCDYLLIVINGKLAPESRNRLADVCDDMFVRRNEGFDSWAYKDGIEYIGYDGLKEYDKLILTNNTMFGPLRPLKDVFAETEGVKCDFWGLQMNYGDPDTLTYLGRALPWGYKPDAVITNFRVIRKNMLHSIEFRRYWQKLPPINDYTDAVFIGELQFSYDMVNAGFVMYTLDKGEYKNTSPSPTVIDVYDQISRMKIPYFRKRLFNSPMNHFTDYKCGNEAIRVLKYIKQHTDYDIGMILENIIRTVNQYDYHHLLALTDIISPESAPKASGKSKLAVVFHAYYPELFGSYLPTLLCFPKGTDIYFTVCSEEKENSYKELTRELSEKYSVSFIRTEDKGMEAAALAVGARDVILSGNYDYICFMHEIPEANFKFSDITSSYAEALCSNTAADSDYISCVIRLFEDNPKMGMAVPPAPTHSVYFTNTDGDWENAFEVVSKFLADNNISVPLDPNKPPISADGGIFWFRTDALRKLAELPLTYEYFPDEPPKSKKTAIASLRKSYSYITQASGYYTAVIMSSGYAAYELISSQQILKNYHTTSIKNCGKRISAYSQVGNLAVKDFSEKNKKAKKGLIEPDEEVYVQLSRSPIKKIAKALIPHELWEKLRKKKCEAVGEKYIRI